MKCLGLQQPYAALIVERAYVDDPHRVLKPIENRSWPLPSTLELPARIYVHASLTLYPDVTLSELRETMLASQWFRAKDRLHAIYSAWENHKNNPWIRQKLGYFGCIIGQVTITGQVTASEDPWFCGPYGYTLTDPVRFAKPIPMKGHLGFFEVPDEIIPAEYRKLEFLPT